ncbi:hypothetical protein EJ05DRAFT_473197 [Pseudovirgaria hyperparasitica]|uniref:Uncharacterized protein n=1 Tax=Pseudovirgaria hyperparasitica TaxID=470096 RepID=A0A6A6WK40_9PEZI|nr:uncharacterized protein EJ05DRAFT_473197 [Pseudovirgaria hyperparasitica]KAF2762281.1 hypothetical protein EJ05DRAFT_473197 [Pseudovirgaria hyperparasitica]
MAAPLTPPSTASRQRVSPDSPFSDYGSCDSSSSASQKDLVRRITTISDMISKTDHSAPLTRALNARLEVVESILSAPNPQSRLHLEDSGLFLDDDDIKVATHYQSEGSPRPLLENPVDGQLDRIAQNVEEHMHFMNRLLDEAKHREMELEDHIGDIHEMNLKLSQRLEEVKHNNSSALKRINAQKEESASLRNHIIKLETRNQQLEAQLDSRTRGNMSTLSQIEDPQPIDMPTVPVPIESDAESDGPVITRWSAFWGALQDAAGILDYERLV